MKKLWKSWKWLISFLKIGCIGFGGGTSLIPVIEQEMVKNKNAVTKNEYDDTVMQAGITPGALTVKISAGIGNAIKGIKGMFMAGIAMALPGVLMTIILLIVMNKVNEGVIKQIEIVSIGITSFILYMLTNYIKGTYNWAKKNKNTIPTILIIIGVFILSAGKSISKVMNYFGIGLTSYLSISTTHILALSFFVLSYVGSKRNKYRIINSLILSIIYILFVSKAQIMNNIIGNITICNWCLRILQLIMIILSIYGIIFGKDKNEKINKLSIKNLIKEEVIWFLILAICSVPAFIMVPKFLNYLGKGLLSSFLSFGGGDAYLTVAEGFFVSSGMVSENYFYGILVTLVNVLPGSTLCKTLTGIGYYIGYMNGGIIQGLAVAFAGFVCSVIGSCSVISIVQHLFRSFEEIEIFKKLRVWIKTIISGLLGSVVLSLIYQCLIIAQNYGGNVTIILLELFLTYILNFVLEKKFNLSTWKSVVISCLIALVVGNIIM